MLLSLMMTFTSTLTALRQLVIKLMASLTKAEDCLSCVFSIFLMSYSNLPATFATFSVNAMH